VKSGPLCGELERDEMKKETAGWFVYIEKDNGWADSFTIEDDDGMPFTLDDLKRFHGKPVRITIELHPSLKPDFGPTARVYERLGLTAKNIRKSRDSEREKMIRS
jgi:hypothetical protein